MNIDEKFGDIQQISQASMEFKKWIDLNNLFDIPINNGKYTWNNRRKDFSFITEKLDRFFFKWELSELGLDIQSSILPIARSNHYLVQIEFIEHTRPIRNPFKCKKI